MLDVEPQKRPTAAQILAHSWMTSQTPSSTQLVVGTKVQDVKVCRTYYVLISFPVFLFLSFLYTTILSWWYKSSIHYLNFSFRAFKLLKYVQLCILIKKLFFNSLSYLIPKLYKEPPKIRNFRFPRSFFLVKNQLNPSQNDQQYK